ncbi:MAG: hypothetical protein DME75_02320 [Verrucomicrobia bacterium]|nr:MAG: hypothetical protein DME75_02320 [Verrucomicrobiota bacterium]
MSKFYATRFRVQGACSHAPVAVFETRHGTPRRSEAATTTACAPQSVLIRVHSWLEDSGVARRSEWNHASDPLDLDEGTLVWPD